jgi:hypothetical protein
VTDYVPIRAQLPELADQFDGDNLAVGRFGLGATLAQASEVEGLQFIVHETEYLKQEFLWGRGQRIAGSGTFGQCGWPASSWPTERGP